MNEGASPEVQPVDVAKPEDKKMRPSLRDRVAKLSPRAILQSFKREEKPDLANSQEPEEEKPDLANSKLNQKISRRGFLKGTAKVAGAVVASSSMVEFLAACTPEQKPLTENEKLALGPVYNFNKLWDMNYEGNGKENAYITVLSEAIAMSSGNADLEKTNHTFNKSFDGLAGKKDENGRNSHFLAYASISTNTSIEDMSMLVSLAKNLDPKMKTDEAFAIAGYAAILKKTPAEIRDLMKKTKYETDGNSSLFLAAAESGDAEKVMALYGELKQQKTSHPEDLTFLIQRNNGDIEGTKKILKDIHKDSSDEYTDIRLALATIASEDKNKVLEMYNVAQDNVKADTEESRGLASALVLSTIDSSATGKLFARSTPIIFTDHGMFDISLNPLYDYTQVYFNTP